MPTICSPPASRKVASNSLFKFHMKFTCVFKSWREPRKAGLPPYPPSKMAEVQNKSHTKTWIVRNMCKKNKNSWALESQNSSDFILKDGFSNQFSFMITFKRDPDHTFISDHWKSVTNQLNWTSCFLNWRQCDWKKSPWPEMSVVQCV